MKETASKMSSFLFNYIPPRIFADMKLWRIGAFLEFYFLDTSKIKLFHLTLTKRAEVWLLQLENREECSLEFVCIQ